MNELSSPLPHDLAQMRQMNERIKTLRQSIGSVSRPLDERIDDSIEYNRLIDQQTALLDDLLDYIEQSQSLSKKPAYPDLMMFTDEDDPMKAMAELCRSVNNDEYTSQVDPDFYPALSDAFQKWGEQALTAFEYLLEKNQLSSAVACHGTEEMGDIEHPPTHRVRRSFLEKLLSHSSRHLRDAASLGLATLDDPASLPALYQALDMEAFHLLHNRLQQVIDQLEATKENAEHA